jgi:hypothetical protein
LIGGSDEEVCSKSKYGSLGLYYKGEQFWQFNGSFYEELEFDVLSAEVYSFMGAAKCRFQNNAIPMIVKPDEVSNVIKCIKAGTTIRASLPQPCWIDTEQPAPEEFAQVQTVAPKAYRRF